MKSITDITVRNYHIDHFGHVNHARYVELLEEARWRYLEDNALLDPLHRIKAFHVVTKIVVHYRHSAGIGDILRMETKIDAGSRHCFSISQKAMLKASGKVVIEAVITNVFVDRKGRPRPIDNDILNIWPDLCRAVPPR